MKKALYICMIFAALVFLSSGAEAKYLWQCDALTGGGSRSVDSIISSGTTKYANDGDFALVFAVSGTSEVYLLGYNSSVTGSENTSTHPYIIIPDDHPALGLWIEVPGAHFIDATTSTKGIAYFDTGNFAVASGGVSLKDSGVTEGRIDWTGTTTSRLADVTDYVQSQLNDKVESGDSIYLIAADTPSLNSDATGVTIRQKQDTLPLRFVTSGTAAGVIGYLVETNTGATLFAIMQDNQLDIGSRLKMKGVAGAVIISTDTVDGGDYSIMQIGAGGDIGVDRGAYFNFYGNEGATYPGVLGILAGNVNRTGCVQIQTENSKIRFMVDYEGQTIIGSNLHPNTDGNTNCQLDVQGLGSFTTGVSTAAGTTYYFGENGAGIFHDVGTGELWAIDDGGTGTQLTAHDKEGRFVDFSYNKYTLDVYLFEKERHVRDGFPVDISGYVHTDWPTICSIMSLSKPVKVDFTDEQTELQKKQFAEHYINQNRIEVTPDNAFKEIGVSEEIEISSYNKKKYRLKDGGVEEYQKKISVSGTVKVGTKKQLKEGIWLDEDNGKFYRKPTTEEALKYFPGYDPTKAKKLPQWVRNNIKSSK